MAEVGCVDGSRLTVRPMPVLDRDGSAYEVTLRLEVDGEPFGEVGERCGFFLAALQERLGAARAGDDGRWPHPDDRYPESNVEGGLASWAADVGLGPSALEAVGRYLPRDHELFSFRHRDPDDVATTGELRATVRTQRRWLPASRSDQPVPGRWLLTRRAVLEAWGDAGRGVRAVLTSGELAAFLGSLLAECAEVGAVYAEGAGASLLRRPAG